MEYAKRQRYLQRNKCPNSGTLQKANVPSREKECAINDSCNQHSDRSNCTKDPTLCYEAYSKKTPYYHMT